jgi:hypothetical protein
LLKLKFAKFKKDPIKGIQDEIVDLARKMEEDERFMYTSLIKRYGTLLDELDVKKRADVLEIEERLFPSKGSLSLDEKKAVVSSEVSSANESLSNESILGSSDQTLDHSVAQKEEEVSKEVPVVSPYQNTQAEGDDFSKLEALRRELGLASQENVLDTNPFSQQQEEIKTSPEFEKLLARANDHQRRALLAYRDKLIRLKDQHEQVLTFPLPVEQKQLAEDRLEQIKKRLYAYIHNPASLVQKAA